MKTAPVKQESDDDAEELTICTDGTRSMTIFASSFCTVSSHVEIFNLSTVHVRVWSLLMMISTDAHHSMHARQQIHELSGVMWPYE